LCYIEKEREVNGLYQENRDAVVARVLLQLWQKFLLSFVSHYVQVSQRDQLQVDNRRDRNMFAKYYKRVIDVHITFVRVLLRAKNNTITNA
jgi:hypothetical protein